MTGARPAADRERAEATYRELQERICGALEALDGGARFGRDAWSRAEGGGGLTRILAEGALFEKAAVNVSAVWGPTPPALVEHLKREGGSGAARPSTFFASGISLIVHPRSPHVPTMHANVRFFETDAGDRWFGGGADLTPYLLVDEDAVEFHRALKTACDRHAIADHAAWKAWCDRYFFLPHRGEARGVGGVFFDHLQCDVEAGLALQRDLGDALLAGYTPIAERRRAEPVTPDEERWHLQRRGRYVEFNLVHDRGTRFGLQTGGRTESILASLPPRVRFDYDPAPPPAGTPAARLLALVTGPARDWLVR